MCLVVPLCRRKALLCKENLISFATKLYVKLARPVVFGCIVPWIVNRCFLVAKEDIVRLLCTDGLLNFRSYSFYLCGTFFDTCLFVFVFTVSLCVYKVVVFKNGNLRKTVYGRYHSAVVVLFILNTVIG